jgi:hypothetical protein
MRNAALISIIDEKQPLKGASIRASGQRPGSRFGRLALKHSVRLNEHFEGIYGK